MQLREQIALLEENSVPVYGAKQIGIGDHAKIGCHSFYHERGGGLLRESFGYVGVFYSESIEDAGWNYGWHPREPRSLVWRLNPDSGSYEVISVGKIELLAHLHKMHLLNGQHEMGEAIETMGLDYAMAEFDA